MIAVVLAVAAAAFMPGQPSPTTQPPAIQPSTPPHPPSNGGGEGWGFVAEPPPAVSFAYEREAIALRTEMRALQEADGGRLTAQHRAYVREKAEALLSAYNRGVRLLDPAVNAEGSNPR
jgi:hypothetical protein